MTAANDSEMIRDIVAPTVLILVMFLVSGIILAFIMRYRKQMPPDDEFIRMVGGDESALVNNRNADGPSSSNNIEMHHF